MGLKPELIEIAGYAKTPWSKTGMIKVEKTAPKEQIIRKLAKLLAKIRSMTAKEK